jgi:hypothetical protein
MEVNQGLVARLSGVPEKVGVNKEGVNQNWYSHKKENFNKRK